MKAKKKILTAATLGAFLALAGAVQAHGTAGDKGKTMVKHTSKKASNRRHRSGKKSHRRHRRQT